jgi:hypothetical protein
MLSWKQYAWLVAMSQLIFLTAARTYAQNLTQRNDKQLEFSATQSGKGIVYRLDGMIISDPLRAFGKAIEKYGAEAPVRCLIDNRLPILVVGNVVATAGKAGFKDVRPFVLDHNTKQISEIKLGPWMAMSFH